MSPSKFTKTRGFIDFDLQLFRADMIKPPAHDKRFDTFNNMPRNLSDNKPVRQLDFNKMKNRDDICYKFVKCSDSLFNPNKHLNLFHKKDPGILQFSKSVVDREVEKRMYDRLKEYSSPQDDLLSDILKQGGNLRSTGAGDTI